MNALPVLGAPRPFAGCVEAADVTQDDHRFPADHHGERGYQPFELLGVHPVAQGFEGLLDPRDPAVAAGDAITVAGGGHGERDDLPAQRQQRADLAAGEHGVIEPDRAAGELGVGEGDSAAGELGTTEKDCASGETGAAEVDRASESSVSRTLTCSQGAGPQH